MTPKFRTALEMARHACRSRADQPLLHYFDGAMSGSQLDAASDALAAALADRGVGPGDRVAIWLQNVPQFPLAMLAGWKLGGIVVPVNPMLRHRELSNLLGDSGAAVLVSADDLYADVGRDVLPGSAVSTVITTSASDYLPGTQQPPALLAGHEPHHPKDTLDLRTLVDQHAGRKPAQVQVAPDDVALLVYTSGTTGPSKGAMNTHRNVAFAAGTWAGWVDLTAADVNLVTAPLFHITGLIAGLGASLAAAAPCALGYRFDPATVLAMITRHRPRYTIAAITAYSALLQAPDFARTDFSCLQAAYTGGAPVPHAVARAWREASGVRLHVAYGLTETTSPLTLTPLGVDGPVDPATGALSVGLAVPGSSVEVLAEDGSPVATGEVGEITAAGPQVVPGYWNKPAETAVALPDGRLRTGDVGFVDDNGWVYLVDRRKDMIISSGYKIWPREVEDVLYTHPAVREAAVVGAPDSYRGETVHAFVSLRPGTHAEPAELIAFCRERMAAYKYPRAVRIVAEIPKNAAGKILRRSLRSEPSPR